MTPSDHALHLRSLAQTKAQIRSDARRQIALVIVLCCLAFLNALALSS